LKLLTPAQIDFILYNRAALRALALEMEPKTSTSVAGTIHPSYVESKIEKTVIDRQAILVVVDTVDAVVAKARPRILGAIVKLKYDHGTSTPRSKIARSLHYSVPHVDRLIRQVREVIEEALTGLGDEVMKEFWQAVKRQALARAPKKGGSPPEPGSARVKEMAEKVRRYALAKGEKRTQVGVVEL